MKADNRAAGNEQSQDVFSRALLLESEGRLADALEAYHRAISLQPKFTDALYHLGNLYLRVGMPEAAIPHYELAHALCPDHPGILNNWGTALRRQGRLQEAHQCFQTVVQVDPNSFIGHNNLGNACRDLGDRVGAEQCYQRSLAIKPDYVPAVNNLGNLFLEAQSSEQAAACFRKAIALQPNLPDVHNNLGDLYAAAGQPDEAVHCYREALRLNPKNADAMCRLFHQYQQVGYWGGREENEIRMDAANQGALSAGEKAPEAPFAHITRSMDGQENLSIARSWSQDVAHRAAQLNVSFSCPDRQGHKRPLVVGYVSGDFREHPVAQLMRGVYAAHDRNRFVINCYAYGRTDDGFTHRRIKTDADQFVVLSQLSDADAARRIHRDGVDILVDLMGHTRGNRLGIIALRPAPVVAGYLGLVGSTGAGFMDYIITDGIVTPESEAVFYDEKFVLMPDTFMATDNTQPISATPWSRADFGLPAEAMVYCSFNNAYKIEPVIFGAWMRILKQVPGSYLWLFRKNNAFEMHLKQAAADCGMDPARLVFSDRLSLSDHMGRLPLADLALDTWIYNGGATTVNALWAGVPVLAVRGEHFASRMSASCLRAVGLPELISENLPEYEQMAIRLGRDSLALARVRETLRYNREHTALFDTPRFVRHLETAYEIMWARYCAGQPPEHISVPNIPGVQPEKNGSRFKP